MKKAKFAIFNDVHLGVGNEEAVIESIIHMVENLLSMNIKTLVCAGDIFHSRSNQTESVLRAADKMFSLINEAGIRLILFPGNHDKTSYYAFDSFLDSYRFHPNLELYTETTQIEIEGIKVTLIPFFADEMLVPMLEEAEGSDILISHFEMQGSSHLGKVSEKSSITKKTLKKWRKTYLGHYHNTHEVTRDIVHLPSLRQSSFGEDSTKGFSIIFNDLSYEIVQGVFKRFNKLILDIDKLTQKDINELIEIHRDSEHSIRFEFIGEESKLKALDKEQFSGTGIDIKIKYQKKYDIESIEKPELVKKFDEELIFSSFEEFCNEKNLELKDGLFYLKKFFKAKQIKDGTK